MNFKILPNGLIKGGTASYFLDPSSGLINYSLSIQVGVWFVTKTYKFSGEYKIDPTILNPTTLTLGKLIQVGSLKMTVRTLNAYTAFMGLELEGQNASGTAVLILSGPVVTLNAIDASVKIKGMQFFVAIRPLQ